MKKLILNCLLVAGLITMFSACGGDDDKTSSSVTFDGETYKLSKGFAALTDVFESGEVTWYEWQIILTSSGITNSGTTTDDFAGTGDALILYVWSNDDESSLPEGTYAYNQETGMCESLYVDFSPATSSGDEIDLDSEEVTITITKSGNKYTIKVTGDVKATFKGSITTLVGIS